MPGSVGLYRFVCSGERQESIEMRSMSIGRDWMNGEKCIDCCCCIGTILMGLWTVKSENKRFCRQFEHDDMNSLKSISQSHRFIAHFHFLDSSLPMAFVRERVSVCDEHISNRRYVRKRIQRIDSIWNSKWWGEFEYIKNHFRSDLPTQRIECIRIVYGECRICIDPERERLSFHSNIIENVEWMNLDGNA